MNYQQRLSTVSLLVAHKPTRLGARICDKCSGDHEETTSDTQWRTHLLHLPLREHCCIAFSLMVWIGSNHI